MEGSAFAFEEILFLFIVGCVIGYVIETLCCFLTKGKVESRKGMVYGPFNQVYGLGAIVLGLLLSPLMHRSNRIIFFIGSVIGGLFEAACSLFQEKVFKTVSWEYSDAPGALFGGRTSFKYMCYWGALSTVYLRVIHPLIFSLYSQVPARIRSPLLFVLFLFLIYDLFVSALAVGRWQSRCDGIHPADRLSALFDKVFPDERMEKIYPNMVRVEPAVSTELANTVKQ